MLFTTPCTTTFFLITGVRESCSFSKWSISQGESVWPWNGLLSPMHGRVHGPGRSNQNFWAASSSSSNLGQRQCDRRSRIKLLVSRLRRTTLFWFKKQQNFSFSIESPFVLVGNVSYLDRLMILRAQAVMRLVFGEYRIASLVQDRKNVGIRIRNTLEETTKSWGLEVRNAVLFLKWNLIFNV